MLLASEGNHKMVMLQSVLAPSLGLDQCGLVLRWASERFGVSSGSSWAHG